jgi:hypothetical protein
MTRFLQFALPLFAALGLFALSAPASAGQQPTTPTLENGAANGAASNGRLFQQVAQNTTSQTANLPIGTIRLRVIPRVGATTLRENISWRILTFGRDSTGKRQEVTTVNGPTPELVLPAGWYVVHAQLKDQLLKHPVEVTANRIFKYTLVKR